MRKFKNQNRSLQVIGVGLGRTGTRSLKVALEQLGFAPCYHFLDVFSRPWIVPIWLKVGKGGNQDWETLFRRFPAAVDYPFTTHYAQVLTARPDCKVILTVREPEAWYTSARETVYPLQVLARKWLPGGRKVGRTTIWHQIFHDRFEEKAYAIEAYLGHIESVKQLVPADQLLVLDVREGWEPLCRFFGCPIPAAPFPHANRRNWIRFGSMLTIFLLLILFLSILTIIFWFLF